MRGYLNSGARSIEAVIGQLRRRSITTLEGDSCALSSDAYTYNRQLLLLTELPLSSLVDF